MDTSSTKTPAAAAVEQPAATPVAQRKGGFIPGAVAAQGCCGTSGSGSGCCGDAAPTTAMSAPAAGKPAPAPIALQSGCCGSSTGSCCG